MDNNALAEEKAKAAHVVTPAQKLEHWQGHRRLTRRVIEAFPEDQLFKFSIGGMRPFSELTMEMVRMAGPGVRGLATDKWVSFGETGSSTGITEPKNRQELLRLWDEATAVIEEYWPKIQPDRFQETIIAFGQWEDKAIGTLNYFIDNEIHHRGQGYVYLRALGIEPPAFWER